MKKETETTEELRPNLKWRLTNKPTLDDVTTMLDKGIITKEEAKSMLFSEEKPLTRDETIKALQEQVEFQKNVIEKLMDKPAPIVWNYISTYTPHHTWGGLTYSQPIMLTGNLNKKLFPTSTITTTATGTGIANTMPAYYSVNGNVNTASKVIDG